MKQNGDPVSKLNELAHGKVLLPTSISQYTGTEKFMTSLSSK